MIEVVATVTLVVILIAWIVAGVVAHWVLDR